MKPETKVIHVRVDIGLVAYADIWPQERRIEITPVEESASMRLEDLAGLLELMKKLIEDPNSVWPGIWKATGNYAEIGSHAISDDQGC